MGLRRFLKLALLSAAALIAAATLALWIFIAHEASGPSLKPRIEFAASDFMGRPVTIGSVSWRPWPNAMLVGHDVRLYDDPSKTLLDVEAPLVEARLSVLSVVRLAAGITELRFLAPQISLRRGKDGVWNVERIVDEISSRPDEPDSNWGTLAFNWFSIEGGTVTIEDAAGDLASLSPLAVAGRGKLRFGRRRLHFPFDLEVRLPDSSAQALLAGDLGGRTRLRIDVKDAEPSLARLAWPPAADWRGRWDGTFNYDSRRPAPWKIDVNAAPLFVSTSIPTFDSLQATGDYYSPSSATFSASALSAGARIQAKGAVQDGALARLSLDVKNGAASLAGLAWPPAANWTGRWEGSLDLDKGPPERWRVHVRAAPLGVSPAAPPLDLLELTGDYRPPARSTFFGTARSATTEIDLNGSAMGGALVLAVKSPRADAKTVLAFARAAEAASRAKRPKAPQRTSAPAASWPRSLTASISAADLRYGSNDFRDVRAVVRRTNGPYVLERLAFDCLGGSITANGSYSPARGDDALSLGWKAWGISIPDAFLLFGSTRDAGGVAGSEGHIVTGLGNRFLPAMTGAATLDIKDGWTAMPGLLKVLSRLNLTTLFAEALGRHRQRLPFDEARAAVSIVKGKVTADKPLVLENKTLQLAFLGTYDLPTRTIDGQLVVNFLTVTDEIIRLIPGVSEILLGKQKGLVPIWVKIKGKADDPDIDVQSARTVAGPVWNTFKHILRLPKTIYRKVKPPS